MEDIEQYLNGTMSDAARQQFETLLATDDRLRAELDVYIGLRQLRLEQSVARAAQTRQQEQRRRFWRQLLVACVIAGLTGLAFLMKYRLDRAAVPRQDIPAHSDEIKPSNPVQSIDNQYNNPQKEPAASPNKPPIAQTHPVPADVPKPLLRSVYVDLDPVTRQLLDTLLTLTQQQQTSASASTDWQKAIQNLTIGQVATAKRAVIELDKKEPSEATWLLALTLLAEGKIEEAENLFQKISRAAGTPRRALAQWALVQLQ